MRKPVLAKKLGNSDPETRSQLDPVCRAREWQREPLRVLFHAAGREPASFDVVPGAAMLVEDSADVAEVAAPLPKPQQ